MLRVLLSLDFLQRMVSLFAKYSGKHSLSTENNLSHTSKHLRVNSELSHRLVQHWCFHYRLSSAIKLPQFQHKAKQCNTKSFILGPEIKRYAEDSFNSFRLTFHVCWETQDNMTPGGVGKGVRKFNRMWRSNAQPVVDSEDTKTSKPITLCGNVKIGTPPNNPTQQDVLLLHWWKKYRSQ